MPDVQPPPPDGTTFHLDELDVEAEHGRWGLRDAKGNRLPRFLLVGCAFLLLLGLLLGLAFEGLRFLGEHYWIPLLWVFIAFLVYRFEFRQRPYFEIGEQELAFRAKAHRAEQRVAWEEVARIDFAPDAVVVHRRTSGPVHLYFPNLSDEGLHTLKEALAEAARTHGVETA